MNALCIGAVSFPLSVDILITFSTHITRDENVDSLEFIALILILIIQSEYFVLSIYLLSSLRFDLVLLENVEKENRHKISLYSRNQ